MTEDKRRKLIVYTMYFVIAALMLTVIFRVVNIQYGNVVQINPFDSLATDDEMPTRYDSIAPLRGRILSDDGSDLVTSIPLYDLHIDLNVIKEKLFEENVDSLAYYLGQYFPEKTKSQWLADLRAEKQKQNQYFKIANNVKYNVLQQVRRFPILREKKYVGGFIEEKHSKRHMPYGLLAQRTLGYKREGIRPVGLEGGFDQYLAGEYGLVMKQYVNGGWKPIGADFVKDPIDGADVVSTISIDIQDVAENELKKELEKQDAVHGSVVVMEVETGFVKAIANLTRGEDGGYYETFNHAVGTKSDPGSTFKLASLMALLEDGKVDITDTVKAYGVYNFYDHTITDSHNGGYGKITIQNAFEVSSNVFSKIVYSAYEMEAQKFVDRLRSFGLGDTLGLDIAGEAVPVLKNRGEDGWSGITLAQMAIGYEVEITPLQTLAFYNAVANNGEFVKPQFVKEIRHGGKVVKEFEKDVLIEKVCSESTLKKLKICLEGVVERGTGRKLQSANFKSAGKTGTARIVNSNRGYGDDYQASFAGYFPADNPKYSCIVVIAGPTQQIYGADVAGTVFAAIANKVYSTSLEYQEDWNLKNLAINDVPNVKSGDAQLTQLALTKTKTRFVDNGSNQEVVRVVDAGEKVNLKPIEISENKVPNVVGMAVNDAVFVLENKGLIVQVEGSGVVTTQSQPAGKNIQQGTIIKLVLK